MKGRGWKWFHRALAGLWALTLVPTVLYWSTSILWVAFMSVYAIIVSHWSAAQAAGAQQSEEQTE